MHILMCMLSKHLRISSLYKWWRCALFAASGPPPMAWGPAQVESLAKPQLRYKVDVNAVENHLTGAAIITDDFCIVIVEGGEHLALRGAACEGGASMNTCVAAAHGGSGLLTTNDLQARILSDRG
jgi:Protein of unknown function (DUF1115)